MERDEVFGDKYSEMAVDWKYSTHVKQRRDDDDENA